MRGLIAKLTRRKQQQPPAAPPDIEAFKSPGSFTVIMPPPKEPPRPSPYDGPHVAFLTDPEH